MEDQHVATILQAISNGRQESTTAISDLAKEFAEFKGVVTTKVQAHDDYISGEKKWNRIKTIANVVAMPLYAIGHAIAARYGIKV